MSEGKGVDQIAKDAVKFVMHNRKAQNMLKKVFKSLRKAFTGCFSQHPNQGQHYQQQGAPHPAQPAYVPQQPPPTYPAAAPVPQQSFYPVVPPQAPPAPSGVPAQNPSYSAVATAVTVPSALPAAAHPPPPVQSAPQANHQLSEPTDVELQQPAYVGQKLWDLDSNRLRNGVDYRINVQGGKRVAEDIDAAARPLFEHLSPEVWSRPTYKRFFALLDNYNATTGIAETETAQERQEIEAFLSAIMQTAPMQYAHKYLVRKNLTDPDPFKFKEALKQMWFSKYRRETQNDSSGFEHVFLGEIDNGVVSGFHNWIQFWNEERKGAVDYRGFIRPRNRGEVVDNNDRILSCQFTWQGYQKDVTTLFIGTSPEFEMALYTIFFLSGQERSTTFIDGYELCMRAYTIQSKYGDKVGSVFPELVCETNNNHQ